MDKIAEGTIPILLVKGALGILAEKEIVARDQDLGLRENPVINKSINKENLNHIKEENRRNHMCLSERGDLLETLKKKGNLAEAEVMRNLSKGLRGGDQTLRVMKTLEIETKGLILEEKIVEDNSINENLTEEKEVMTLEE